MVSALESLSHIPKLLNYIFDSNFDSKQSTFKTNFRQSNGTFEHYIVKNNFPQKNQTLQFMKPLEKEAYAIIFEKVWAVVRGGFKHLDGGTTYEVLLRSEPGWQRTARRIKMLSPLVAYTFVSGPWRTSMARAFSPPSAIRILAILSSLRCLSDASPAF